MFSWISGPFLELVFLYWLIFYNKTIVYYSKEKEKKHKISSKANTFMNLLSLRA